MPTSPTASTCWGCQNGYVYLKLGPAPTQRRSGALPAWEDRVIPDQNAGEARFNAGDDQDWHIVNVEDVHLGRGQAAAMAPGNDRTTIITFAIVALLILGMAVVNFTNLATARASQRAREVALRKALGATRKQLIVQFVGESIIVAVVAMLIALAMVELLLPAFAAFLEADIQVAYFGMDGIVLPVLGLVLIVGILGGLYPAFFLSRFEPASVLKANKSSSETPGTGRLRSVLVVAQFAVSIALIICTAVVYGQTVFARTIDPGYNRSQILQIEELSRYQLLDKGEMLTERMRRVPGRRGGRPDDDRRRHRQQQQYRPDGPRPDRPGHDRHLPGRRALLPGDGPADDRRPLVRRAPADGRHDPAFPQDLAAERALAARGANIVINELAARRLGINNPADAVGRTFRAAVVDEEIGLVPITVVGVVRDARFRSVRLPLDPIMFMNTNIGHSHIIVRFRGNPAEIRAGVGARLEGRHHRGAVQRRIQRRHHGRALRGGGCARADLCRLLAARHRRRLPRPVRPRRLHRRAADQGDRHPQGARRPHPRHRPAARLAILQADHHRQPDRLAGRLVDDARLAQQFRRAHRLGPAPFVLAGLLALVIAIGRWPATRSKVSRANPVHALRYE